MHHSLLIVTFLAEAATVAQLDRTNALTTFHSAHGFRCKTRMFSAPTYPEEILSLEERMAEAVVMCGHHPGCFGVQLFEKEEPENYYEQAYCMKWCGRPQFCLAPILDQDSNGLHPQEVAKDPNFYLFVKPLANAFVMAQPLLASGPSSVPARCSFAGRVVPCFDPTRPGACAKHDFKPGSRAFVFTHDLQEKPHWLDDLGPDAYITHLLHTFAKPNGIDVVVIVPRQDLAQHQISLEQRRKLEALGVRLLEVDWIRPELGKGIPKWAQDMWCVDRDLFKLHAFGLEYDAVVFYDNDVLVDPKDFSMLGAVFDCAYQGYFLTTGLHGGFEPLSVAFFALRPSPALLRAVQRFLLKSTFDDDHSWNNMGYGPWGCLDASDAWCFRQYHVGGECGQGLLYDLFFMADPVFWSALQDEPGAVRPLGLMLDGCTWLYENSMRVQGFPDVHRACADLVEAGRCGSSGIVAWHKVIEGRGCAEEGRKASLPGLLKLYPSDENASLYIHSTKPAYAE